MHGMAKPAPCRRARWRGWSLVEMLVGVAIFGSLVLLAGPVYRDFIAKQELLNAARALADTLNLARTEAIKHGYRVNVCKSADGRQCSLQGSWAMGWIMHTDDDRDGEVDVVEGPIRREGALRDGITISANRPVAQYVSYTSLGYARMLNGALQMGTFTVCKTGQNALDVVLANSGRVRIDRTQQRCP